MNRKRKRDVKCKNRKPITSITEKLQNSIPDNNLPKHYMLDKKASDKIIHNRGKPKKPVLKELTKLAIKLVSVVIVIVSLFSFVFGAYRTNDLGMVPNIAPGDFVIYYRLDKNLSIGDTVIYNYKGKDRIARVVALPNDTVDIDEKGFKVNGGHQYEPKIYKETLPFENGVKYPITLAEDEYFILGDNRDKTTDSRLFGSIKKNEIKGNIFLVIRSREI